MNRSITVNFPSDAPVTLQLSYSIEMAANVQTISCSVNGTQLPLWLQLRKFEMSSIKASNGYTPLFNEINNARNMDTALFIDKAYADIMLAEKCKVANSN